MTNPAVETSAAATLTAQEYAAQSAVTALALVAAQRLAQRAAVAAKSVNIYQAATIALAMQYMDPILTERGISTAAEGAVVPSSLLTPPATLTRMLQQTTSPAAFDRVVVTMVRDAARTARTVDMAVRPAVTGYVRRLTLPCCSRCAILAGRFYRWSEGFERHPQCDCDPTPADVESGRELISDPQELFDRGQITDLSAADAEAIRLGADMGKVVNVQRRAAGLRVGSSVMDRGGKPTPAGILRAATDRDDAIRLLTKHGYIVTS